MTEQLSAVGEFALIERLLARIPTQGDTVVIGPGADDAAVLRVGGRELLATADLSIEGRHFDLRFSSPADAGWKAMTVNISDIAAMGGRPLWALVSVGAPASTDVAILEQLYDGLGEAARAHEVIVVGGDTVGAEQLVVSVALLGETGKGGVLARGGAREGDLLCVTDALGGAAAGLALLRAEAEGDGEARALLERYPELARAHRRPVARVREAMAAAEAGARAAIDVSDGFLQDALHVATASGLGLSLTGALPQPDGVAAVEGWRGDDAAFAATGGDDYELILAVPPDRIDEVTAAVAPTILTPMGRFTGPARSWGWTDGGPVFSTLGWDSFGGGS